jgi:hypothetical protein
MAQPDSARLRCSNTQPGRHSSVCSEFRMLIRLLTHSGGSKAWGTTLNAALPRNPCSRVDPKADAYAVASQLHGPGKLCAVLSRFARLPTPCSQHTHHLHESIVHRS